MAFVEDDPNKLQDAASNGAQVGQTGSPVAQTGQAQAGQSTPGLSGGESSVVSASGSPSSSGPATGGQAGTGGTDHWTNIQDYLSANAGNTASSKFVANDANQALTNEQNNLSTAANSATGAAQAQVDKENIGQDAASKLITDATAAGKGTDPYNQNVGQLKSAVTDQFSASPFAYGLSSGFQNVQNGLSNNFDQYMSDLYNKNAGGQMTQGQSALQHQLDLDPTAAAAIQDAKTNAINQLAGFSGKTLGDTTAATNTALQSAGQKYGQEQQALNGYLTGAQNTDQSQLNNLVTGWNTAENQIKTNTAPNTPQDNLHFIYGYGGSGNGFSGGTGQDLTLNKNQYVDYRPGDTANQSNVEGGDPYRQHFNTIADVLGQQAIAQAAAAQHGTNAFDASKYQAAVDALSAAHGGDQLQAAMNGFGGLTDAQDKVFQTNSPWTFSTDKDPFNGDYVWQAPMAAANGTPAMAINRNAGKQVY